MINNTSKAGNKNNNFNININNLKTFLNILYIHIIFSDTFLEKNGKDLVLYLNSSLTFSIAFRSSSGQ